MTSKERMLAVLSRQALDCIPVAPEYLALYLAPRRSQLVAAEYRKRLGSASEYSVSFEEHLEIGFQAFQEGYGIFEHLPDWMTAPTNLPPSNVEGAKVVLKDGELFWAAPGSDQLTPLERHSAARDVWDKSADLKAVEKLLSAPIATAEERLQSDCYLLTQRALQTVGDTYLLHTSMGSPFWSCYSALGFAGLMKAVIETPDLLHRLQERSLRDNLESAKAVKQVGIETIFIEECLSSHDLISTQHYLDLVLPYTRRLLEGLRALGLKTVYYYCGDVLPRIPYLKELPFDALSVEESKKGFEIDMGAVRKAAGEDIVLVGNIDASLIRDATKEQIEAEVRRQVAAAGAHGNFIVGIGSPLTLDTEPEKLDFLVQAARSIKQ